MSTAKAALAMPQVEEITLAIGEALRIAELLERTGHGHDAQRLYRRILETQPEHPEATLGLATFAQNNRDHASALNWLRQLVAAQPGNARAFDHLGVSLAALGHFDEALMAYYKAVGLDANSAGAHAHLAAALKDEGWLPEAVDAYRKALALAPERIELYADLGWALHRLGRGAESADVYRQWLAVEPDNTVARHLLAARSGESVPARADPDYVQRLFDGYAERFDDSLRALDYRAPGLLAAAVAAHVGEPDARLVVLDAGCGTGLCGPLLRPYAAELVGVDLSQRMLDKARERQCYDRLLRADLVAYLRGPTAAYDLIASADTLVYFGDLEPLLTAACSALRRGGWLVFTTEFSDAAQPEGYRLERHGRYGHNRDYLESMLHAVGLDIVALDAVQLRLEVGEWVAGTLAAARKPLR